MEFRLSEIEVCSAGVIQLTLCNLNSNHSNGLKQLGYDYNNINVELHVATCKYLQRLNVKPAIALRNDERVILFSEVTKQFVTLYCELR